MRILQIAALTALFALARVSAQEATPPAESTPAPAAAAKPKDTPKPPKPIDKATAHELSQMQTELYRIEAEYRSLNSQLLERQDSTYKRLQETMETRKGEFDKAVTAYRTKLTEVKKKSGAADACDIDLKQEWNCPKDAKPPAK